MINERLYVNDKIICTLLKIWEFNFVHLFQYLFQLFSMNIYHYICQ